MRIVSEKAQQEAAEKLVSSLNKMDGVESSVDIRTSGTQNRPIVNATVSPENWRKVAEHLKEKHSVDHCSRLQVFIGQNLLIRLGKSFIIF